MRPTRRAALAGAATLPFTSLAATAQARWQMATPYPDGNFHTRNIREFVTAVESATSDRVAVQLHSNASLLPMAQIKRGAQQGQVQLGEILLSAYGNEDVFFELDSIPQLARTYADARRLMELTRSHIETRSTARACRCCSWCPGRPRVSTPTRRSTRSRRCAAPASAPSTP